MTIPAGLKMHKEEILNLALGVHVGEYKRITNLWKGHYNSVLSILGKAKGVGEELATKSVLEEIKIDVLRTKQLGEEANVERLLSDIAETLKKHEQEILGGIYSVIDDPYSMKMSEVPEDLDEEDRGLWKTIQRKIGIALVQAREAAIQNGVVKNDNEDGKKQYARENAYKIHGDLREDVPKLKEKIKQKYAESILDLKSMRDEFSKKRQEMKRNVDAIEKILGAEGFGLEYKISNVRKELEALAKGFEGCIGIFSSAWYVFRQAISLGGYGAAQTEEANRLLAGVKEVEKALGIEPVKNKGIWETSPGEDKIQDEGEADKPPRPSTANRPNIRDL